MTEKKVKKRNWAFILWPDSAPTNWRDILQESGLLFAISPFHDKDIDPTGEPKKPHYHVIMCFEGPTTYNNALSVAKRVNANTVQPLEQIRGYYRYFTHMDNADKYQYDDKDITTLNGFDINNYVELTYTERINYCMQIQQLIIDKNIKEYFELLDYLYSNDLKELLEIAYTNTILFNTYLSSRRHSVNSKNNTCNSN